MKRKPNIMIAAVLSACLSATSWADDDGARFESSGFLKSLDAFIAEQMAKQREASKVSGDAHLKELTLSMRDRKGAEKDFFRLSESHTAPTESDIGRLSVPDFSSLMTPTGELKATTGFDELVANNRLKLAFGAKDKRNPYKQFELSLKSGYRVSSEDIPAPTAFTNGGLEAREYNLGVTLGYSGFGVDASLTRQTSVFTPESIGFDVGFSYQTTSFAARLSLSEYHEGADLYGIENEVRSIVSVELGASYRLSNAIGLNGGVRYYDYGDQWLVDPEAGENSKMIFLGGQLKF